MYFQQLLCKDKTYDSEGNEKYVFSLEVLLANTIAFSVGFLPFYFVFNPMIFNKKEA